MLYLRSLAAEPHPLITLAEGTAGGWDEAGWHRRRVTITETGRAVIGGDQDAVALRGVDRWMGGVHLRGRRGVWRWDRVAGRVVNR